MHSRKKEARETSGADKTPKRKGKARVTLKRTRERGESPPKR